MTPSAVDVDAGVVRLLFQHVTEGTGLARMVLGEATDAIALLALRKGCEDVAAIAQRLAMAHWVVLRFGCRDELGRIAFADAASELSAELMKLGRKSDFASGVAAAREYLERLTSSVGRSAGHRSIDDLPDTWWEVLYELAADNQALGRALADFNDASVTVGQVASRELGSVGELNDLHKEAIQLLRLRGIALADAADRAAGVTPGLRLRDRIFGVVGRMEQRVPNGGGDAVGHFLMAMDQLDPEDPIRHALQALGPAFGGEPLFVQEIERALFVIRRVREGADETVLRFLPPAKRKLRLEETEATVRALSWRVQGLLGEMAAMSSATYRRMISDAVTDGARLARELNAAVEKGAAEWVCRRVRRVRAPAGENNTMALFYDDVVVLVREGQDGAMGDAHILLATQVKSGDFSSQMYLDQVVSDLERETRGRIELDGVYYAILASGVDPPVQRVCILTSLPSSDLASRLPPQIELRSHETNGQHFADIAGAMVAALTR